MGGILEKSNCHLKNRCMACGSGGATWMLQSESDAEHKKGGGNHVIRSGRGPLSFMPYNLEV